MKYLIENATVVTMNKKNDIYENTSVAVDAGIIVGIGSIPEGFTPDKTIDSRGLILMPGLINAHTHSAMTYFRNYADDLSLKSWLEDYIWPIEGKLQDDDIYWGSKVAILEMISSGTTCFMDMYFANDKIKKAVEETKIRAVLTPGLMEHIKDNIDLTTRFIKDSTENDLVQFQYGPHAIYTSSTEYLKKVVAAANENNARIHIHLSESKYEYDSCLKEHNLTPTAYLESIGMLDLPLAAAHCVYVTDDDILLLKKHNVSVLHNPTSNLKLGNGVAPVSKLLKSGVNVALGTDGASSNNNLNMFEEMHIASLIHKGFEQDPEVVSAREVLQMATINGAKALGLDSKIGSIEVGKDADMIWVDSKNIHHLPNLNLESSLAYSTQASDVTHVMIHGELVYYHKQFTELDKDSILNEFLQHAEKLYQK